MNINYQEVARKILEEVGGKKNVLNATNCMTRLRLQLLEKKFSTKSLKNIPGVLGVIEVGEELQIIFGPGKAANVTNEFRKLLENEITNSGDSAKNLRAEMNGKSNLVLKNFLKKIASIFTPLIPGFISCGLITGITSVLVKNFPDTEQMPEIQVLMIAGNSIFLTMNLFVGFNAAKIFGGTPILGGILATIMSHPNLSNITIFGESLLPGRGGIISVILVVAFNSWIEKKLHKIIPEIFELFLTPLLSILISGTIAIIFLQPIGGILSETIGSIVVNAVQFGGIFTGFILAGLWLPLVMLGIHQAFTPIHVDLILQFGVTILLPILAMAGAGQVGASIAVYIRTRNRRLRKTILSALPVGIMGVGEPLIYGVTLPLGKPFLGACIGGAFGGAIQALFMVGASTLGISGLTLAPATNNIPIYLFGLLVAYAAGFIVTYILGFEDPK